ncbi:hypothetical protein ACHWQZ_G016826 [Mnemiopsis leidyi]
MGNEQASILSRTPLESPCELQWSKDMNIQISGREGHSSVVLGKKVYSYGGLGPEDRLNGLTVFDTESNTLQEIQVCGEKPGPLCNASLNRANGTSLYLFGGLNRETGWNNDIWQYDTETVEWKKLSTSGIKPSPRDKHTAVLWGKKIVIFGGFGPATGAEELSEDSEDEDDPSIKFTWFNDLYLFDTESNSWDAPNVSLVDGPVPRAAHSATIYNDKMIIFGGKDSKARNQDLFSLDLTTLEWSSFKDAGARPPPTSFHTAVQFGQFMITYGGRLNDNSHSDKLNVLDCETGGWYAPVTDTLPSARGQCSLSVLDDGTLIMFGGSNKFDMFQQCCQEFDTSVYKLDCNVLKTVEVPEPVPEVEMTNEAAAGSSQVEDTKLSDQSEEVQNDKLAGV